MSKVTPKIFCAIDMADMSRALSLIPKVVGEGCGLKLGMEFFNAHGPDGVRRIMDECGNPPIFLDLKYHDIPNTVAGAVREASKLGVMYLNVHASGGLEMMRAAKDACAPSTKLLGVTVLTSLDDSNLASIGQLAKAKDQVKRLAELTQLSGLDGVICSAHEITMLREDIGKEFILMTPGIRPAGASQDDQKRVMTPKEAMDAGASHLVIGRPITGAPDPAKAVRDILRSLEK
jgi:orotidine-5'-phosphate decarboxylase